MTRRRPAAIALLLLLAATTAGAGEPVDSTTKPAAATPSDWEFEVAPYMWVPGTYGTIDVRGRTAHVSLTPSELLQAVFDGDALGAAGYASARWRRVRVFVDAYGAGAKSDQRITIQTPRCPLDVDAKLKLNQVILDVGVGGDVGRWTIAGRTRPLTLGVYAGMRYVHMGNTIHSSAEVKQLGLEHRTDASVTFDWADPLIGVRFEMPLHERLSLDFRGDIGGFGASSDLVWGLVGDVRYWMEWNPKGLRPWVGLGYRAAAFDRSASGGGVQVDMQFRGPTAALGLAF